MEEEKEITGFELSYDGMFHIQWTEVDKTHKWYIHLEISALLRMFEIEGITFENILEAERKGNPIKFEKVTLKYFLMNGNYLAYWFFDESLGNTLRYKYTVELFQGDSLKNHKHETIMGRVELTDDEYYDLRY